MLQRMITINGRQVPVYDDELTGDQVKEKAGIPHQERAKRQIVLQRGDRNQLVPDHQPIRVTPDAVFTHHPRHSKAARTSTLRERRIRNEADVLRRVFPKTHLANDLSWVLIDDYKLPDGWQPSLTTTVIVPPPNYPEAAPDGFYIANGLRKRSGRQLETPGHYFPRYKNPWRARGYFWYCLEDPDRNWNPRYDSLLTFLDAIWTYLGSVPD